MNIVRKNFLIAGFNLTSPPLNDIGRMIKVEQPVLTAVYYLFVNHENKVQLLKRLDIVEGEERSVRVKLTLGFLTETKNLFDFMAAEDPGYRAQEIFQSAGILPMEPQSMFGQPSDAEIM
jgi:hypothetical protein